MAIINDNQKLVVKQDLIRQADQENNSGKKEALLKKIGVLEKEILEDTIKLLKTPASEIIQKQVIEKNSNDKVKDAKKMLKEKYTYYQDLAKLSRKVYADLVSKKRQAQEIYDLLKNDKTSNKGVEKTLQY